MIFSLYNFPILLYSQKFDQLYWILIDNIGEQLTTFPNFLNNWCWNGGLLFIIITNSFLISFYYRSHGFAVQKFSQNNQIIIKTGKVSASISRRILLHLADDSKRLMRLDNHFKIQNNESILFGLGEYFWQCMLNSFHWLLYAYSLKFWVVNCLYHVNREHLSVVCFQRLDNAFVHKLKSLCAIRWGKKRFYCF